MIGDVAVDIEAPHGNDEPPARIGRAGEPAVDGEGIVRILRTPAQQHPRRHARMDLERTAADRRKATPRRSFHRGNTGRRNSSPGRSTHSLQARAAPNARKTARGSNRTPRPRTPRHTSSVPCGNRCSAGNSARNPARDTACRAARRHRRRPAPHSAVRSRRHGTEAAISIPIPPPSSRRAADSPAQRRPSRQPLRKGSATVSSLCRHMDSTAKIAIAADNRKSTAHPATPHRRRSDASPAPMSVPDRRAERQVAPGQKNVRSGRTQRRSL